MTGSTRKLPLGDMEGPGVGDEGPDPLRVRTWEDPQFALAIRDTAELQHTCYIELCPDHLRDRTCWNGQSLYYTERTFGLLSPLLDALDGYTPCSFLHYDAATFEVFVVKLEELAKNLREAARDTDVDGHWYSIAWLPIDERLAEQFYATRQHLLALTADSAQILRHWRTQAPDGGLHVLGL